jgi:hypothetical protein
MQKLIETFPIASAVFVVYAIVGGVCTVLGSLSNADYVDSLLKVGAGTGAIGAARAVLRRGK